MPQSIIGCNSGRPNTTKWRNHTFLCVFVCVFATRMLGMHRDAKVIGHNKAGRPTNAAIEREIINLCVGFAGVLNNQQSVIPPTIFWINGHHTTATRHIMPHERRTTMSTVSFSRAGALFCVCAVCVGFRKSFGAQIAIVCRQQQRIACNRYLCKAFQWNVMTQFRPKWDYDTANSNVRQIALNRARSDYCLHLSHSHCSGLPT